jgi:glycosyltransferase involved in cell wall biosynthesis
VSPALIKRQRPTNAQPTISVVVPAFNEEQLLAQTLGAIRSALEANGAATAGYEIIVCDNNSSDRTAEIARQHGASVVFEPINQIARARNAGAAVAQGDWLVFVDADSMPDAALVAATLATIETGRFAGGSTTVQMCESPLWWRAIWAFKNRVVRSVKIAYGAYIFCRRDAFEAVGGFSTKLYAVEDVEFANRLKRYARTHSLEFAVLHENPIVTSARKASQPFGRLLRTTVWIALTPYTGVHARSRFGVWYDIRR